MPPRAKPPRVTWLEIDRLRRRTIRRFDRGADDRQRRVLRQLPGLDVPEDEVQRLRGCSRANLCAEEHSVCGICSFRATDLITGYRKAFTRVLRSRPNERWAMVVLVPAGWQRATDQLLACDPKGLLPAVLQRLRRSALQTIGVIALDVTYNAATAGDGQVCRYWAPHLNILTREKDVDAVVGALRPIWNVSPTDLDPDPAGAVPPFIRVAKAVKRSKIDDPFVAMNYAAKLDLNQVRGRNQEWDGQKGEYRLKKRPARISCSQFQEFLAWRLGFPVTSLVVVWGIRRTRKRWRLLGRKRGGRCQGTSKPDG